LWGHPRDGSVRQDLTAFVSDKDQDAAQVKFVVTEPNPGTQVAIHESPALIAKQPGKFTLQGILGSLQSKAVTLTVSGAPPAVAQLKCEPSALSVRIGETSAPIQIVARSKGDRIFRPVDAQWESLNASVATVESGTPSGRITGTGIGHTQIRATYGGLSSLVDVKVVGDRFRQIADAKLVNVGRQTFCIELDVQGDRSEGEIEYRLVRGDRESGAWTKSKIADNIVKATLTSPPLKFGPLSELYHLKIESRDARDKTGRSIELYPYSFRISSGVIRVDEHK
jgi:hypothetical protein